MKPRYHVVALFAAALLVVTTACSGGDGPAPSSTTVPPIPAEPGQALEELEATVGLLITMMPGSGLGPEAEQLMRQIGAEVLPGTADHVATVPTPGGRVDLVTYREGEMSCVAEIGRDGTSAACDRDRAREPGLGMYVLTEEGDRNSVTVFGGADAAFAILATEKRARIGIRTVAGWAHANWAVDLGAPVTITFYDGDGSEGFSATLTTPTR